MKRAIAWFGDNHVAANLLMMLMVVGGFAAIPMINQKSFPDIEVPVIQIAVPYLGAAPEEVEEAVCVRIEEAIQAVDGIERITSTASEGACGVSAELITGYPEDRALTEIKNKVDSISTFPDETEKPVVSHVEVRRTAMQVALAGDTSERSLKIWGERLRDEVTSLPGVTQVDLGATRSYEISVEVSEAALRRYGLGFGQVAEAVRRGSLDRPGGAIRTAGGEVLLRTVGQAYTGAEFERIPVLQRDDGTRVLLRDVAKVIDGFSEDPSYASFDGEPAVLLVIYRVGEQRVLDLVETVQGYVDEVRARLPDALSLTVWRDGSQSLRDRLDILVRNGLAGFVLVFVVLALFLRLRLAFWVAIGVPIAFLGSLSVFPAMSISIDVISLFAFILVLGLLVDDAIVIGENIHRHQENHEDPLHASIRGAQEVAVPVIFGVLTTVAAFLPMIMAPGGMGQIFGAIGTVVICCLFFSLAESQLILPAHLGHMRTRAPRRPRESRLPPALAAAFAGVRDRFERAQAAAGGSLERAAKDLYSPLLERVLYWRYATIACGLVLLAMTVAVLLTGHMKFAFFPPVESDYVTARLAMPPGTPVEKTAAAVRVLERSADATRAALDAEHGSEDASIVKHVLASVGSRPSSGSNARPQSSSSGTHLGEVSIELMGGDERPISSKQVASRWRDLTPAIPDVDELTFRSTYFDFGAAIDVQLQHTEVDVLTEAAERLKGQLATFAGVSDVADSFVDGKRELELDLLPSAEPLGLTLDDLAAQVRAAFYGAEAQRIQRGRDDVRVMVRYPEERRKSLAALDDMRIRTPAGTEVPFYAVARANWGRGYASIRRADRQRVINVTADVDERNANANELLAELRAGFLPQLVADYPGLSYGMEGEQREQAESLGALASNYLFALVLIYALLAVPLRSYAQPFIIMGVIPFGLVGAVAGHLLMQYRAPALGHLSMMSIFGMVALTGVVVNSSLVLVHYVNQRRGEGYPLEEAVRSAGVARFRPIVLTSITTFVGLFPLLSERSMSAQFLIPMATSLGFGVVFATFISLMLVPSSYVVLEDLKSLFRRKPAIAAVSEPTRERATG